MSLTYVLSKDKKPLMPTRDGGMVRILLKTGRAKVVRREPFTIRLLYETSDVVNDLTLGVDTGSGTLAVSVSDDEGNIYYASEVEVRNDIRKKMDRRRAYRRNRRYRKTRHRKPRFLNRKNSKRKDRLSPTMISKLHSHEKEIAFVKKILPINTVVLETGKFDPALTKNPDLKEHKWGYQKGFSYGYSNIKEAVRARDKYTCQKCKKNKNVRLDVHHIIFRSQGGTDQPENLVTLCHPCHIDLHAGKFSWTKPSENFLNLKDETQMNVIRAKLLNADETRIETFGCITKKNREELSLPKEHFIDAAVVATGGKMPKLSNIPVYKKKCIPKGDYQRTKGVRSELKMPDGKICGFKKFDKVLYYGKEYFIKGRDSKGYAILMGVDGKKANFSHMPKGNKTPKMENMKRIEARKTWIISRKIVQIA